MSPILALKKRALEIAHILQKRIEDYKRQYRLGPEHAKILSDLLNCRTAKLGGRVDRCDTCGSLRITYHSCRNRHCPKCQHMPRERWQAKRKEEILTALPLNMAQLAFITVSVIAKRLCDNLKSRLYDPLWIVRPDTPTTLFSHI
jgi:hypothetical protein